ncbi:kDa repressor of the inhibitor of the protein kinase [Scomber scombrus]|uniref:KDa repressor of the inhibitor of the protein kinase n=1 Tax=Scomber scombrus TaxID=13677 RepID=A0AAV1P0L6_SCOSC
MREGCDSSTEEDDWVEEEDMFVPATAVAQASCSTQQEVQMFSSQPSTSDQTPNRWPNPRPQVFVPATTVAQASCSTQQKAQASSSQPSTRDQTPSQWQNDYGTYIDLIHETSDKDNDDDLYSAIIASIEDQTYDGASTMSGRLGGVQQKIRELQTRALFTHCRSHALNLVVVHGCTDVTIVRNTMGIIEKIAVFFSASAPTKNMLQEPGCEGTRGGIPLMSDTRWGSRIQTVGAFLSKLGPIHSALQDIESEGTRHNSEKATTLRNSIESFDTIVTAVVMHNILGYILPLTTRLQSPNVDIVSAYKEGREVALVIQAYAVRRDTAQYINKQCSWPGPLMLSL